MKLDLPGHLLWATAVYAIATTVHFVHNAVFLDDYPNLPDWFTASGVVMAVLPIHVIGILGLVLVKCRQRVLGTMALAVYAAFGFDGLAHYAVAPFLRHSVGMNGTILFEVLSAFVLFVLAARLLLQSAAAQWMQNGQA